MLDTIQDLGRYGYQHSGINPSGAMDRFAARVANILACNPESTAVIELHFPAGEYFFEQSSLIAITGADYGPMINGDPIPINHPIWVNKFSVLQFSKLKSGARAYLAVHGGFRIDRWLDSFSTNLKAHAGGLHGSYFKSNEDIAFSSTSHAGFELTTKDTEYTVLPYYANYISETHTTNEVYVIAGKEWGDLAFTMKQKFLRNKYSIMAQSDRMGYRLKGDGLDTEKKEIISSGVSFGTIQLLPDGQLIILMADHQTTGGYPRIAHVISAHHSMLAQKKSGEYIKFKMVEINEAQAMYLNQEKYLKDLTNAISLKTAD